MVLYRKYRPQKLSEIFGQEHIKQSLLSSLEEGKISHGYLFAGPKGTGKTSTARIFAKAVNCEQFSRQSTVDRRQKKTINNKPLTINHFGEPCNKCQSCVAVSNGSHMDVLEIDAASNRGIDEIRDLREKIKLSPVQGRFKVYIIDEAHMLTTEAFNALLKTLEEPPSHVIFILCTTSAGKLPSTIISRLTRFRFLRAHVSEIVAVLKKIAKKEEIEISPESLLAIAQASDGAFRDAISLLDQLSANKKVSEEDVKTVIKISGWDLLYGFSEKLQQKDLKELISTIEDLYHDGVDMSLFIREVIGFLEKLLFVKIGSATFEGDLEPSQVEKMKLLASGFSFGELQNVLKLFLIAESEIKIYVLPQIPLVLAVSKYCGEPEEVDGSQLTVHSQEENRESKSTVKVESEETKGPKEPEDEKKIPKTASSAQSLAEIEAKWGEFLAKVKPVNAHLVALLRSSRPTSFDGEFLTLEVFFRFHKEKLEEPKIMKLLSGILEETMDKPVKLTLTLANRETKPTPTVAASDVVEINQEELSEIAQEIFSK